MAQVVPEQMPPNLWYAIQEVRRVCHAPTSKSQCFEWGSLMYKNVIRHFLESSTEVAQIAVQPGSANDLALILNILKMTRAPFAVKGGGHAMGPHLSSTTGIQISMARFADVIYDPAQKIVEVGAGCLWEQVYNCLGPWKRNVIGGAAADGVGVAGWLLGGGYSLKSNRYGLGIDNVVAYEIITPDDTGHSHIRRVTAHIEPELFHALRGGGNNFGIVTKFFLKTHPQTATYGARLLFKPNLAPGDPAMEEGYKQSMELTFRKALLDFIQNEQRPEAAIVAAFRYSLIGGHDKPQFDISLLCAFDRPKPNRQRDIPFQEFYPLMHLANTRVWQADPAGWTFGMTSPDENAMPVGAEQEPFQNMPPGALEGVAPYALVAQGADIHVVQSTLAFGTSDMYVPDTGEEALPPRHMMTKKPDNIGEKNARGRFGCLMVKTYTEPLLVKMSSEAQKRSRHLKAHGGLTIIIDCWPVHGEIFHRSPLGAAYPHEEEEPSGPLLLYFQWKNEADDEFWIGQLNRTLEHLRFVASAQGVLRRAIYSNLSMETVPVEMIYRENLDRLKEVKLRYDPTNVMGNAGGFRIPLPGRGAPIGQDGQDGHEFERENETDAEA